MRVKLGLPYPECAQIQERGNIKATANSSTAMSHCPVDHEAAILLPSQREMLCGVSREVRAPSKCCPFAEPVIF
jgi:hypothetical protein